MVSAGPPAILHNEQQCRDLLAGDRVHRSASVADRSKERIKMRGTIAIIAVSLGLAAQMGVAPAIAQGPAFREVRPSVCQGSVFEGARAAEVECTKVVINGHDAGRSSITFVVRESTGEWFFLQAFIKGGEVVKAATASAETSFTIEAFFVQPANDKGKRRSARWPLQGSCRVSGTLVECRTNDVMGGFVMKASI
jgi:hypothetical protein